MKIATVGVFSLLCLLNAARGKAADHAAQTQLEALQTQLEALQTQLASQEQLQAVEQQIKTLDKQLSEIGQQLNCFAQQQKEKKTFDERLKFLEDALQDTKQDSQYQIVELDERLRFLEEALQEEDEDEVPANVPANEEEVPAKDEEVPANEEVPAKVPAKEEEVPAKEEEEVPAKDSDSDSDSDSSDSYDINDTQYRKLIELIDNRLKEIIKTQFPWLGKTWLDKTPTSTTTSSKGNEKDTGTGSKGVTMSGATIDKDLSATSTTTSSKGKEKDTGTGSKDVTMSGATIDKDLSGKTAAILGSTIILSVCIMMVLLQLFVYRLRADQVRGSNMK